MVDSLPRSPRPLPPSGAQSRPGQAGAGTQAEPPGFDALPAHSPLHGLVQDPDFSGRLTGAAPLPGLKAARRGGADALAGLVPLPPDAAGLPLP